VLALGLVLVGTASLLVSPAGGRLFGGRHAIAASPTAKPQCSDPYPATRDPSNPLMLPAPPGPNPLNGASFFVPGPAHGSAAGAIAQLLGLGKPGNAGTLPDSESWAEFKARVDAVIQHRSPSVARKAQLLEKTAEEPEAQRISTFVQGGGPGAIYSQVQKIFCHNLTADPGTVPIFNTYFLHPIFGGCPTRSDLTGSGAGRFRRQINEMAAATGNRPVVYLLEIDAIGSSGCISKIGSMPLWESLLRYEIDKISALPHTVVYVEGGYSDANGPRYTARILNAVGVDKIRGFFTNDTHEAWTINEIHWGQKVSALTHGADFVINTSDNGRGPKLNPHPTTQGIENLCNPPGRGLGPRPTTSTGSAHVDAFVWEHPPGNSSGCGGGPPAGVFWPARAEQLAADANGQLGPGYPSMPY
jgi:endoglucanase